MYPQENRLKKIKDFDLIVKYGHWINGSLLLIKILKLTDVKSEDLPKIIKNGSLKELKNWQNQLKIATAVGLKINKSAVKRNRLKRQIREIMRLILKDNRLQNGYYILIQPKKECLEEDYAKISQELELLLKKGKILNG
jgi:ribonuclease P protein component